MCYKGLVTGDKILTLIFSMLSQSFVKRNKENSDFVWTKHQKAASNSILTSTTRPLDSSIFNFGIIIVLMSRKNFFWMNL